MKELPINQIICDDCLEVMRDWPDKCVDLVLTDPPWNLGYFDNDNKPWNEYAKWLDGVKQECERIANVVWIFQSIKDVAYTAHIFKEWRMFASIKNFCQMVPTQIPNSFDVAFYNNSEGYQGNGRNWHLGQNSIISNSQTGHPTSRPLDTIIYILNMYNAQIILDPFCGSGTTCVAAKMLGRRYIGIDISPEYCKIAEERLKAVDTGVPVKEARQGQGALFV
jgi:DNA modification methylase